MTVLTIPDLTATSDELFHRLHELPPDHPARAGLRVRIIRENLPMAYRLARRYAGRGELLDDLTQVAALALVRAVDCFEPGRQVPFVGYAIPSILGGLRRHFRDSTWAIRVPRSAQELTLAARAATDELCQRRGRSPTTVELAAHLHVSVADLLAAGGVSQVYRLVSLDAPPTGGDVAGEPGGGIDPHYAAVDDRLMLRELVAALPARERRILDLRFGGEMTQAMIGHEVGLSQMQVSRLLSQSLARLRSAMPT